MTTHHSHTRVRAGIEAAIVSVTAVLLAACAPGSGPAPPTLDEAIRAVDIAVPQGVDPQQVLILPRLGRGGATFEVSPAEPGRFFKVSCVGEGHITLTDAGGERFSDQCNNGQIGWALGADAAGATIDPDAAVQITLQADEDVYWVATAFVS